VIKINASVTDNDYGMKEIIDNIRDAAKFVDIGIQPDETEELLKIAAIHEFGGTINMPARSQQIFRKINKDGDFSKSTGSRFVKKDKSNFASWVTIPAYTITIPARPYIRSTVDTNEEKYGRTAESLGKRIADGKVHKADALALMGQLIEKDIKRTIIELRSPPNAPATIRKKGSDNPLVDTGLLGGSIRYIVHGGTNGDQNSPEKAG